MVKSAGEGQGDVTIDLIRGGSVPCRAAGLVLSWHLLIGTLQPGAADCICNWGRRL